MSDLAKQLIYRNLDKKEVKKSEIKKESKEFKKEVKKEVKKPKKESEKESKFKTEVKTPVQMRKKSYFSKNENFKGIEYKQVKIPDFIIDKLREIYPDANNNSEATSLYLAQHLDMLDGLDIDSFEDIYKTRDSSYDDSERGVLGDIVDNLNSLGLLSSYIIAHNLGLTDDSGSIDLLQNTSLDIYKNSINSVNKLKKEGGF